MRNNIQETYEGLTKSGIERDGIVDVTFLSGEKYGHNVMQFGHNLKSKEDIFALESEISGKVLKKLDGKSFDTKKRYISMRIYYILKEKGLKI